MVVDQAVVAVLNTPQLPITFTGGDVATRRAALADAGRELHVPLAVVALAVSLVREHAGRADLDEVSRELILQHAIGGAPEIHVVGEAVDIQVRAAGVVLVIPHTAVARDATIHLVIDEGAEILVLVRALGEAVAARCVT